MQILSSGGPYELIYTKALNPLLQRRSDDLEERKKERANVEDSNIQYRGFQSSRMFETGNDLALHAEHQVLSLFTPSDTKYLNS